MQHAGLDRVGADIVEHDLHLLADESRIDRQDAVDPLGVLRGQRGDRGRREGAEHRHRLDVGLNAGAAAGIGAGDDEDAALHGSRSQIHLASFEASLREAPQDEGFLKGIVEPTSS